MLCEFTVAQPYYTNVPEDRIVNTWHFFYEGEDTPSQTSFATVKDALMGFYEAGFSTVATNSKAAWVSASNWQIKAYDLAQAKPRVPVYSALDNFSGATATTSSVPPEVALCVSYQADYLPGINPQSMRGRIFIGGIGAGIQAGAANAFPAPSAVLVNAFAGAASVLVDPGPSDPLWSWVMYSQKLGVHWPVTKGWIDNALDTQRRRGQAPSGRTLWT